MIDKLHLYKAQVSEVEKLQIIDKNNLTEYTEKGVKFYRNFKESKFFGGLNIEITTKNELKIFVSVHKYYYYLTTGKSTNHLPFSMKQARETILKILDQVGTDTAGMFVKMYEVGLNIVVPIDVKQILQRVTSVQAHELKKAYINPKYRDERAVYTEFHKEIRVHFKLYDKVQEMKDRRATEIPKENILRIETSKNRQERLYLQKFLDRLEREQVEFFKDWNGLRFEREIKAPKGTTHQRKELVKNIFAVGLEQVKNDIENDYKNGVLTPKQRRVKHDFLKVWDTEKKQYKEVATKEEKVFLTAMKRAKKQLLKT